MSAGMKETLEGVKEKADRELGTNFLYDYFDLEINRKDVQALERGGWLTDIVIAGYFRYLENIVFKDKGDSILFFDAGVTNYAVREDVLDPHITIYFALYYCTDIEDFTDTFEDFEVEKKQLIFLPINDSKGTVVGSGTHWTLLVFDRSRENPFLHFDSSRGAGEMNGRNALKLARKLVPLLGLPKGSSERVIVMAETCPQQTNGSDCGAFVCKIAEALASGRRASVVSQADMQGFRKFFTGDIRERATKTKGYD